MAITRWRDAVVGINATSYALARSNPLAKKRDVDVDGPSQVFDEVTTDDSSGPEHAVVYAGQINSVSFPVVIDRANSTWTAIEGAAEAGTEMFCVIQPQGAGSASKREVIFKGFVDMKLGAGGSGGMARATVTLKPTNGCTWQVQP